MLKMIEEWLAFFGIEPMMVVAMAVGYIVIWGATQRLKRLIDNCHGKRAVALSLAIGLLAGGPLTFLIAPGRSWLELGAAIIVVLTAPALFKALTFTLGNRWAWVKHLGEPKNAQEDS